MATVDLNELEPPTTDDADLLTLRLRIYRNRLLVESDWTQLPDAPCDAQAWAAYRQQLRDFPATWTPAPVADFPDPPA
jgi:hypothetical protein